MIENNIYQGDSFVVMKKLPDGCADMIYLDPPFFSQETQTLVSSKDGVKYTFDDKWKDMDSYLSYLRERLEECKRLLKRTGSIFVHCDRNASHYLKVLMDQIFSFENFQSEIIWNYKRWSNSKKGLLNNHQNILFYSKTSDFKFHKIYTSYSETTNVDQILQERARDSNGKSVYKLDQDGNVIVGESKKGVPLSDVWEIPYLNPKAKERVGYPTQKPVILLEQMIKLVTDPGDLVIDPFVGSGTTVVAAKMLNRKYIGIDQSKDAVELTKRRLNEMIKTESGLLQKGKAAYRNLTDRQMKILDAIGATPVQRNSGIDGFLKQYVDGRPVSVKIQKDGESLEDALSKLIKASKTKHCVFMILVRTHVDENVVLTSMDLPENVRIIDSYEIQIEEMMGDLTQSKDTLQTEAM